MVSEIVRKIEEELKKKYVYAEAYTDVTDPTCNMFRAVIMSRDEVRKITVVFSYQEILSSVDCALHNGFSWDEAKEKAAIMMADRLESKFDEFILKEFNQVSSEKIHSFGQKLKELNLENKPVFIKMDIAGAEIGVMPDILKYADNIVGMAVVFRMNTNDNIIEFDKIAKEIEKNFVPVVRNMHIYESYEGCKCRYMQSFLSVPVCITYVNKKLITSDTIPFKQSCYEYESYIHPYKIPICLPRFTVNWVVVLDEKIKKMFGRND